MSQSLIRTLMWFVLAVVLQITLFMPLNLGPYINVFPYILFIILVSDQLPKLSILLISTLLGILIDLFSSDVIGPHMLACATIGYIRPHIQRILFSADFNKNIPTILSPFNEYLLYTASLVFIHHVILFTTEVFDANQWFFIIAKTLASTFVNIILISLLQMAFIRKKMK